jgi:hypothetical protein
MMIRCYVCPQGRILADGLEAVELYVLSDFESQIKKPEPHVREPVLVVTATGVYRGGLRTLPPNRPGDTYLCPDLSSESDGLKVSLARILKDKGIESRDEIDVRISDGRWEIV